MTGLSAGRTRDLVRCRQRIAIYPAAAAREGEPVLVKNRIRPFVGADLETLLRADGIEMLVLSGALPGRSS